MVLETASKKKKEKEPTQQKSELIGQVATLRVKHIKFKHQARTPREKIFCPRRLFKLSVHLAIFLTVIVRCDLKHDVHVSLSRVHSFICVCSNVVDSDVFLINLTIKHTNSLTC